MTNQLETTKFKERADLSAYIAGRRIISYEICFDNSLALLLANAEDENLPFGRTEQEGWASFPQTHADRPYKVWCARVSPDLSWKEIEINAVADTYPVVQWLPDGSVLIVSQRCEYTDEGPEQNAAIYDEDGALVRRFCLGDGINRVLVTCDSRIWAGYSDEGIFGNFGWGGTGKGKYASPIGAAGIVCFDLNGTPFYEFQGPSSNGYGFFGGYHQELRESGPSIAISDCYSLNAVGETIWSCFYSHFPIARIDPDWSVSIWESNHAGASRIAVEGNYVALCGGYEDQTACIIKRCNENGKVETIQRFQLWLPDWGEALHAMAYIVRGGTFHILRRATGIWYQFDLRDLLG